MIPVTRSSMPPFEEYITEIKDLWDSVWLTNAGAKHQLLEQKLAEVTGVPHVSLFTNGHLALENAIAAYGLKGEVITTPFTFISTTHAITRNGLTPVFCDIKEENFTIDASKIEQLITDRTCAIVPVHVYGNICDIEKIDEIAHRYGLKVIYDAAHAFGVKTRGVSALSFGDIAMCSFHATKAFHTIEGGALFFKDDNLAKIFGHLRNFGMTSQESVDYIAGNAKMNEFQAAMGICNLRHFKEEVSKRKKNAERYYERLSEIEGIKICPPPEETESNYAYMPVLFDGVRYKRDEICNKLAASGIFARKYFYPLTSSFSCYRKRAAGSCDTPVAKRIANNILTMPLYASLKLNEVDMICDAITK